MQPSCWQLRICLNLQKTLDADTGHLRQQNGIRISVSCSVWSLWERPKGKEGKEKYKYIPEYDSAGFSNTCVLKRSTPKRRKYDACIYTGSYIEARIWSQQDWFSFLLRVTLKSIHGRELSTLTHTRRLSIKTGASWIYFNFIFRFLLYFWQALLRNLGLRSEKNKQFFFSWYRVWRGVRSPLFRDVT